MSVIEESEWEIELQDKLRAQRRPAYVIERNASRYSWGHRGGVRAFQLGRDLKDNPFEYENGHPQCRAWIDGWKEPQRKSLENNAGNP